MSQIKNIVFDLGGVIINIDPSLTFKKFAELAGKSIEEVMEIFSVNQLVERHETGALSDDAFFNQIGSLFGLNNHVLELKSIWGDLLNDIPRERIDLIQQLSEKYKLFLLSNTNHIHFIEVENILQSATGIKSLDDLFEKVYLSYQIGLRKPHTPIYEHVLVDSKLIPSETLFIDDNLFNILGAASLGIQTIHIQLPETILDHLNRYV
jgi:epoxide hydrolase-like predicted phosphatase